MSLDIVTRFLRQASIPTPVLLMSRDTLRSRAEAWNQSLPHVTPHYAVKANIDPLILRELFAAGVRADVASAFEMNVCRTLGVTGADMILSNPRKDIDTLRTAAELKPWAIAVDSEEEIERLSDVGIPSATYSPVLFVRIKVPTQGVKQDLSSKFGVRVLEADADPGHVKQWESKLRLSELRSIFTRGRDLGFRDFGLAFHVGTQCADPIIYHNAFQLCRLLSLKLALDGLPVTWLDLGGGFADSRIAAEREKELDQLFQVAGVAVPSISPVKKLLTLVGYGAKEMTRIGFKLIGEPGRCIVADAGTLVSRVIYDRATTVTGRRVQIDDGVYRTLSGRIHDGRDFLFQPLRLDATLPPLTDKLADCAVWGCSCDSFDKVSDGQKLPANLQVGDYLIADCVGAYSTSFGSNTNGFQPAITLLYWEKDDELRWQVSPLIDQNAVMLNHVAEWVKNISPLPREGEGSQPRNSLNNQGARGYYALSTISNVSTSKVTYD